MEILRVRLDRLVAPLQPGRQEPRQSQNYPPDAGSHAEEVQHHEEDGAQLVLGALGDGADRHDVVLGGVGFPAGDRVPGQEADHVGDGHHHVAHREEYDGALRVSEPVRVDEESANGEEAAGRAEDSPSADPHPGKLALVFAEKHLVARRPAVFLDFVSHFERILQHLGHFELFRAHETEISTMVRRLVSGYGVAVGHHVGAGGAWRHVELANAHAQLFRD